MKEEVYTEQTAWGSRFSIRRASWGAVFSGMFVTIVLQVMLTLLGTAIGAATLDSMRQQSSSQGMAIGSGIWLLVTGLISIWIGACVAGRLSGGPERADGLIHGIVSWSASTVGMLLAVAAFGGALLSGTGALISGALAIGASTQGGQAEIASFQDQLRAVLPQSGSLLPPTGRTSGAPAPGKLTELSQQDSELSAALARMQNNPADANTERQAVVNLLTSKHGMSHDDAESLLNQWDQQFRQARTQAGQSAESVGTAAAHGIAKGALWGFIALFLGLLAAAWGGWAGTASLGPYIETKTRVAG